MDPTNSLERNIYEKKMCTGKHVIKNDMLGLHEYKTYKKMQTRTTKKNAEGEHDRGYASKGLRRRKRVILV